MNPTSLARAIRRILLELRSPRPPHPRAAPPGRWHECPVAAALAGMAWASGTCIWAAGPALAVSLGDMADEAAGDLQTVPGLIAIAFYIIGAAIVGFGLLKLKRHVDHPAADHHRLGPDRHPDRGRADCGPCRHQRARRHLRRRWRQPHRPQAEALGGPCPCRSKRPPTTFSV